MVSYSSLILYNPIVPISLNGYHKEYWCDYEMLSQASIKKYRISVYANTYNESVFWVVQLKEYLEKNPNANYAGVVDDISIDVKSPVKLEHGYRVDMIFTAGMLRM